MSRRNKTQETVNNKPRQAESQGDGRLRDQSSEMSTSKKLFRALGGLKCTSYKTATRFLAEKITQVLGSVLEQVTIEVDDKWVKFPLSAFDDADIAYLRRYSTNVGIQLEEKPEKKKKGGRNPVKRLFSKISDSKVVQYFNDTKDAVKKKCRDLYEGINQYCTCFMKAAIKVFSHDDDPYGLLTHYHRVLEPEVPELPTRKTLNNWLRWFEDWRPAVTYEDRKAKKERARHRLWEKLIEWIQSYLTQLAPQYAFI